MSIFAQTPLGDWDFSTGNLRVVRDPDEEVAIRLTNRFKSNRGEWFADTRVGFPWFISVYGRKQRHLPEIRSLIERVLLETPGVTELLSLTVEITSARELRADARVRVQSGAIVVGQIGETFIVEGAPFERIDAEIR